MRERIPSASRRSLYLAIVLMEVVKSTATLGSLEAVFEPFFVVITITPLEALDP